MRKAATRRRVPSAEPRAVSVVVTCEHGGNRIPRPYASLFRGQQHLLATHRGYDPGALTMARSLSRAFSAALIASTVSRLLVELNRSPGHPAIYSEAMRKAPEDIRSEVYRRYYLPYRARVERTVRAAIERGRHVVHISSHSFTPVLDGVMRGADVGLLYDPHRLGERRLCMRWQSVLRARTPDWRVRRNYPYKGTSDGLTRYLRGLFPGTAYSGIELEINQKRVRADGRAWAATRLKLVDGLRAALGV